jgi:hypothetical protein
MDTGPPPKEGGRRLAFGAGLGSAPTGWLGVRSNAGSGIDEVDAAITSAPFVKYAAPGPEVGTAVASAPFVK